MLCNLLYIQSKWVRQRHFEYSSNYYFVYICFKTSKHKDEGEGEIESREEDTQASGSQTFMRVRRGSKEIDPPNSKNYHLKKTLMQLCFSNSIDHYSNIFTLKNGAVLH